MKKSILWLGVFLGGSVYANEEVRYYDWLTMGEKSGEQTLRLASDGHWVVDFAFSDRGRGPQIQDQIWFDEKGKVIERVILGHSYMGAKVEESFHYREQQAHWRNTQEQGESDRLKAFYSTANGAPIEFELVLKNALKSNDLSVDILPSGTIKVAPLVTQEVKKAQQTQHVTLYAISGTSLSPSYVWFDQNHRLFALDYGWMGMTPKGWGHVLPTLQKAQKQAEVEYIQKLAQRFTQPVVDNTLITNVRVFNGIDDQLSEPTQVLMSGGKIIALGELPSQVQITSTLDGKGRTLMPGLWDMHAHVQLQDGLLNIAAGVTSVRDLANQHESLLQATDMFASGEAIGPSVYRAGFIDKRSPYAAPTGKLADTLEEALAAVDWYAARGYQQIKIYSSIEPEWVAPIAKRVHHHGMRLSGHIPSFMTAEAAVQAGFDEIQHINMVFLNFLAGPDDDTRTPTRFTLVGEKAGDLDLDSDEVNDFIALLKRTSTVVDPTVTIFDSMFINKAGEVDPGYANIAHHLPVEVRRGLLSSELDISPDKEQDYAEASGALLKMIKKLFDAGVQLVPGTDAMAGFTLHRELELYAKAGIPNAEVLKIATSGAARVAGQKEVGVIAEGMRTDMILIDGNPLQNISDIRRVALVIKGNRAYEPAKLYGAIGVTPFVAF